MFAKILIANRGEIACRVMRTARKLGIGTVAVYSDADAGAMHVAMADEAVRLGPAAAADSYLAIDRVVEACKVSGADAVHPGYGFLAENADFVDAIEAAGLVFVGPPASAIRAMGRKDAAKALMNDAGVRVVPGYHGDNQDPSFLAKEAAKIGYPVLIKARSGGGGKGMRRVDTPEDFTAALGAAQREGEASFGDGHCILEKYIEVPRHIEVQVFGDNHGNVLHLFERDCSLQRRHQKVIEEAPAPGMSAAMRAEVGAAAVRAAQTVGYTNAGTVEFIADVSAGLRPDRFYFMEMNTRLQVEHPVTEFITGLDLVELQLRVAAGERLPFDQDDLGIDGWAFEARIYAEDPAKGFLPATGHLAHLSLPADSGGEVRVDAGVRNSDEVSRHYDPMIAKLIVHGPNRDAARRTLTAALAECHVAGLTTNLGFLSRLSSQDDFAKGNVDTGLIERHMAELTAPVDPPPAAVGLAAVMALGLLVPPDSSDPWVALAGWRLWRDAQLHVLLERCGERVEAEVWARGGGVFHIKAQGRKIEFAILDQDRARLRFECDGGAGAAAAVHLGLGVTVFLDGQTFRFELPDRLGDEQESDTGGDRIVSPLPGLVKLVSTKRGAEVASGETLMVIEAMKMEHALTAGRNGVVEDVLVTEGQQVEDGTILIALQPEDASG